MKRNEKIDELTRNVEEGVKALFNSEQFKNFLAVMGKFHQYSFNNTILISLQRPEATAVAGYTSWKNNFDRHVKPGAKGIKIIQPSPYVVKEEVEVKDSMGNKEVKEVQRVVQAFKVGYVFALEDTEGTPLPEIVAMLKDDVKNFNLMKKCLEEISPVPVAYEPITGSANGYYDLVNKRIVVDSGLSESQTIKTLIHEIAHSILHDKDTGTDKETTKREREVEAESVAYSVAAYYGLDTSEYSFGYIAGWSDGKDLTELRNHLEAIKSTTEFIVEAMDDKLLNHNITNDIDEIALRWPEGYLHVQTSEEGYDYTIYDRFYKEADGGRYETSRNIGDVYAEILKDINVDSEDVTYYNVGSLLERVEEENKIDTTVAEKLGKSQHRSHK